MRHSHLLTLYNDLLTLEKSVDFEINLLTFAHEFLKMFAILHGSILRSATIAKSYEVLCDSNSDFCMHGN